MMGEIYFGSITFGPTAVSPSAGQSSRPLTGKGRTRPRSEFITSSEKIFWAVIIGNSIKAITHGYLFLIKQPHTASEKILGCPCLQAKSRDSVTKNTSNRTLGEKKKDSLDDIMIRTEEKTMKLFTKKEDRSVTIKVSFPVTLEDHADLEKFLAAQGLTLGEFMTDSVKLSLKVLRRNKETKGIFKIEKKAEVK